MDTKYRKVIVQVATEEAIEDTTIFKIGEEFYVQRWLSMNFKDKVLQSSDPVLRRQTEDLKIRECVRLASNLANQDTNVVIQD